MSFISNCKNPASVTRSPRNRPTAILGIAILALLTTETTFADNVDELVELYRIEEDLQAQHAECMAGAVQALEFDLESGLAEDEFDIERGDPDWALLGAIYSEFYAAICNYLEGDEIINFYRVEIRKRFTTEEIDALIEFNKTPLGQKVNEQWLLINRDYGELLNERQQVDSADAQRRFERRMQDFWEYRRKGGIGPSQEQDV